MRKIQLRDAKASLSAVVDAAAGGEPVVITRRGEPEAVIVGFQEYRRLCKVPSFARLLMAAPTGVKDVVRRDRSRPRRIDL